MGLLVTAERSPHMKPSSGTIRMPASPYAGVAMYRFLECTANQYMTPQVKTVIELSRQHGISGFPVVEE